MIRGRLYWFTEELKQPQHKQRQGKQRYWSDVAELSSLFSSSWILWDEIEVQKEKRKQITRRAHLRSS